MLAKSIFGSSFNRVLLKGTFGISCGCGALKFIILIVSCLLGVITKRELDQILRVLGKADDELYECVFACESDEKLVFVSEVNRLVANNLKRDLLSSDLRILARFVSALDNGLRKVLD